MSDPEQLVANVTLPVSVEPTLECEVRGEWDLLCERGGSNPTCPDVLITWPEQAELTVESKFTEHLGGCSQPKWSTHQRKNEPPVKVPPGCSGNYEPGSDLRRPEVREPCRLTVAEGQRQARRYWEVAPRLFEPEAIRVGQSPCPFRAGSYQLMRNLSFAEAWAERSDILNSGFLLAYVAGARSAHETEATFQRFASMLRADVQARVGLISYEQISKLLREHDTAESLELAAWLDQRLTDGLTASNANVPRATSTRPDQPSTDVGWAPATPMGGSGREPSPGMEPSGLWAQPFR